MSEYANTELTRAQVDALKGPAVLDFGTNWCGFCRAAQPVVERAFAEHGEVPHFKVEDGKGRSLGRSYRIKLWPTLIFLHDGQEVARIERPDSATKISAALAQISTRDSGASATTPGQA